MEQAWCWGLSEAIANNGVHWTSTRWWTSVDVDAVGDLAQSQQNQLQIHRST